MAVEPLSPDLVRRRCDPDCFDFETTAELTDLDRIIGQDRAVEAVRFGIGIQREGYNIFAMGPRATGKHNLVREYLRRQAAKRPVPDDLCYVYNFADPNAPRAIRMPPGRADDLKAAMETLVQDVRAAVRSAFESDEFQNQRQALEEDFGQRPEVLLKQINDKAEKRGLVLLRTPQGMAFAPLKDGEVMPPKEFEALPKDQRDEFEEAVEALQGELKQSMRQVPRWERELQQKLRELARAATREAAEGHVEATKEAFSDCASVRRYLDDVLADMAEHAEVFLQGDGESNATSPPLHGAGSGEAPGFRRYRVNVMVSHRGAAGAPVIYEDNPTFAGLLGRVERAVVMGALVTDFNLIRPGCLHKANGGYLIVDARRLLQQPMAWEALKRSMRACCVRIESLEEVMSMVSTASLEPEPVPLEVKIALMGDAQTYYLMSSLDPDFDELFKVLADFDDEMDYTPEALGDYARLIAWLARREGLRPLDRGAVARIVEESGRMMADRSKLSVMTHHLADLVREADYWAGEEGHDTATAEDVQRAVDAALHRADRVRERMQEQILRDTVFIDTVGTAVGQINGLSVMQLGKLRFGKPTRITARVSVGTGEVVDIEREVELSGPIHSKGVLILEGLLRARYSADRPLSLSASLVFEQSYGGVDGDSASSTEFYAIVSAVSGIPLRQDLAVTGSVNQHGRVQPIGGANEKIEGFYDVCMSRGLTGNQGVMIPISNVDNLMLRPDVAEAVAAGRFGVYAITTVDEGIELLTGMPAGQADDDGVFPEGTVNAVVAERLRELADVRREFSRDEAAT